MNKQKAIDFLINYPYKFARMVGFTDLAEIHNKWIVEMVTSKNDITLQAHRGSYKTTCVSVALSIIMILYPNKRILFLRKTEKDVKEVINQVKKILSNKVSIAIAKSIYGVDLIFDVLNLNEISTNLTNDTRGVSQLVGLGIGGSLTGKHFDFIFTDDIVNMIDRISKAERDKTKLVYQELQNIKNKGGRIYNTGTPWHKDDCFSIMPKAEKYDCYSTGMLSKEEIEKIKSSMTASLFCANYELKHISSEDIIFENPSIKNDISFVEQGEAHIDAAYGGSDFSVLTIVKKTNGKYYVYGKIWNKHIDDCLDEIQKIMRSLNCGRIFCEDNGDKGYLAKELKSRGERAVTYHENMNKFLKITSYLKAEWKNVYFVEGTDEEFINQICDYNENAEHDDAPDSLASQIRRMWKKTDSNFKSIFSE